MMLMSSLLTLLFLGAWSGWFFPLVNFILKVICLLALLVIVRATLPRYRYDQLMAIGWQNFLPLTLGYFIFLLGLLYYCQGFIIV